MRRPETQLAAPMQAPCSPHTLALHPAADRTPRPSAPGPQLGLAPCARQLGEDGDDLGYEIAIEQELGYLKGVGATFDAKAKVGRPPQPHPSSSVHPGPSHRTAQHSTAQHSTAQLNSARCARAVQELVLETWKASVVGNGHERVMSAAVPARVAIVGKGPAGRGGAGEGCLPPFTGPRAARLPGLAACMVAARVLAPKRTGGLPVRGARAQVRADHPVQEEPPRLLSQQLPVCSNDGLRKAGEACPLPMLCSIQRASWLGPAPCAGRGGRADRGAGRARRQSRNTRVPRCTVGRVCSCSC